MFAIRNWRTRVIHGEDYFEFDDGQLRRMTARESALFGDVGATRNFTPRETKRAVNSLTVERGPKVGAE